MKKLLAIIFMLPGLCLAAPYDLIIQQMSPDGTEIIPRLAPIPPASADGLVFYEASTMWPKVATLSSCFAVKANLQTLWTAVAAVNPGARIWQNTCTPRASGTFATLAGQTVDVNNGPRVTFNTDLRGAVPSGLSGVFDPCSAIESSLNSGKWQIPNYTTDGTHAILAGNLAIVAGNVFPAASFVR